MATFDTMPSYYKRYTDRVTQLDLHQALATSMKETVDLIRTIPEKKGSFRYEAGKWSIKEVICHLMDVERIFAYRALRFARNDKAELPGFEENDYAPEANADSRTIVQLANELERLHTTTCDLFSSFTTEMLNRKGSANRTELSVENIGYIIAGHTLHHREVLAERYLKQ